VEGRLFVNQFRPSSSQLPVKYHGLVSTVTDVSGSTPVSSDADDGGPRPSAATSGRDDNGAGSDTKARSSRRMGAEQRRAQLITVGLIQARTAPLDAVTAESVAPAAGVSKALVFHYFPTNRDLQLAILEAAGTELLARIEIDPAGSPEQQLRTGLDSFVTAIAEYPALIRSVVRSAGSDPQLLHVFEDIRVGVTDLIASALGATSLPPGLRLAVRGWIAMAEEMVLSWTDHSVISRQALVDYLHSAAFALLPAAIGLDEPDAALQTTRTASQAGL